MTHTRSTPLLRVEDLCVSYDRPILRDVNFAIADIHRAGVEQGQVVSIIGRSGIGKSQLFRCMAGLQQPSSGRVLIGKDLHPVVAGEVGVVPQNYVLLRHRTVGKNLMMALDQSVSPVHQAGRAYNADDVIAEHANDFDLRDHLKKYPHELSGGQRQRVSILQQILAGNRTILLDEPFSGLDAPMIEKVLALLRKVSLLHEEQTLVIVSHDIESAMAISDTVFVLAPCPPIPDPDHDGIPPRLYHRDGATIIETLDLAEQGLAFREDIREDARFREAVKHVKARI